MIRKNIQEIIDNIKFTEDVEMYEAVLTLLKVLSDIVKFDKNNYENDYLEVAFNLIHNAYQIHLEVKNDTN